MRSALAQRMRRSAEIRAGRSSESGAASAAAAPVRAGEQWSSSAAPRSRCCTQLMLLFPWPPCPLRARSASKLRASAARSREVEATAGTTEATAKRSSIIEEIIEIEPCESCVRKLHDAMTLVDGIAWLLSDSPPWAPLFCAQQRFAYSERTLDLAAASASCLRMAQLGVPRPVTGSQPAIEREKTERQASERQAHVT